MSEKQKKRKRNSAVKRPYLTTRNLFDYLFQTEVLIVGGERDNVHSFIALAEKFNKTCVYDCYVTLQYMHSDFSEVKIIGRDADMPITRAQFQDIINAFRDELCDSWTYDDAFDEDNEFWLEYRFSPRQYPASEKSPPASAIAPPTALQVSVKHPTGEIVQFKATAATTFDQLRNMARIADPECSEVIPLSELIDPETGSVDTGDWSGYLAISADLVLHKGGKAWPDWKIHHTVGDIFHPNIPENLDLELRPRVVKAE